MINRPLGLFAAAALLVPAGLCTGCSTAATSTVAPSTTATTSTTEHTPRPALTATTAPIDPIISATPAAPHGSSRSAGGSAELVAALARQVPTVTLTHTFTADDDLENLLGRPGGYIGKAAFTDSRVPASGRSPEETDVDNGGSVEVFATAAAAQRRKKYIERILKTGGGSFGTEYLYVSGPGLLRVSGSLTPTLAAGYRQAWTQAVARVL